MLHQVWQEALSDVCTNFRKAALLLNDLYASARIIGEEVNALDLIGIETIRRSAPNVYGLIRKNSEFLTPPTDPWERSSSVPDKRKEKEASDLWAQLEAQIAESAAPRGFRNIVCLLFPRFVSATKDSFSSLHFMRPTNDTIAELGRVHTIAVISCKMDRWRLRNNSMSAFARVCRCNAAM